MKSYSPATNEVIWEGSESTTKEVQHAFEKAKQAQKKWRNTPIEKRCEPLIEFEALLQEEKQAFGELISLESGKLLQEAILEVDAMIGKIQISLEAYHERCKTIRKGGLLITHRAVGVLGVLGPFNFPGHLPNGHIVPALLAGNSVVFKPSEHTPMVGEKLVSLWQKTSLPKGVLQLVQGGKEVGQQVVSNPLLDGLLFTGSFETATHLAKALANTPNKLLALELGGNNAILASEVQDIKEAAQNVVKSAFLTSGQRCTCARRLVVIKNLQTDNFMQEVVQAAKALPLGPLIEENICKKLIEHQKNLKMQGAKSFLQMTHREGTNFVTPAILDVTGLKVPDIELFGPFLHVIFVDSFEKGVEVVNDTAYGLSAALFSKDLAEWETFHSLVNAGIINFNTPTVGASSAAPFGGVGKSGNHRPTAFYAADYCSDPIVSIVKKG